MSPGLLPSRPTEFTGAIVVGPPAHQRASEGMVSPTADAGDAQSPDPACGRLGFVAIAMK